MLMTLKVLQYILHGVNKWFDVEHHSKSFSRRPLMSTYCWKRETYHWCMQASRYWRGVSKSTSWMMWCCWQEAPRRRGALMYPTSMTRNEVNDFRDETSTNDTRFRNGGHENEGLLYCKGWSFELNDFSWTYRRHWSELVALTQNKVMDGMIDQRCDNHQGNNPTQIVMVTEWNCHVQEWPATIKWFPLFPIFLGRCWPVTLYFYQAWGG